MIPVAVVQSRLGTGGAERMLQSLVRGLDRARFPVTLLTLYDPGPVGEALAAAGVPVVSHLARGAFDPGAGGRLGRAVEAARARVLFTTDSAQPLFWSGWLRRRARVPALVVGFHSTGTRATPLQHALARASALPVADRLVALADSHRDFLCRRYRLAPGRFVEIANGVDLESFHPAADRARERSALGLDPAAAWVGIVAALRPEKHHELFLAAAAAVAARRPEARFLVVGDGPERSRLERLAAARLGDRVRFLGVRQDVAAIQRVLDVAVLTSHPVVETLPLTLIEAHASAVPAVSTRVGSVDAIVEEGVTGHLVAPGDAEALAGRLESLLADPVRRAGMGAAARRRAEQRFGLPGMCARYARLFEELAR